MSHTRSPHIDAVDAQLAMLDLSAGFEYTYWLIDPALADPHTNLPELKECEAVPLLLQHNDLPAAMRPVLLVGKPNDALIKVAQPCFEFAAQECLNPLPLGEPRARSMCAFISTSLGPHELVGMLAKAAIVMDSNWKNRIVRFWDPRVIQHIEYDSSAPDLLPERFIGTWTFLDSHARVRRLTRMAGEPRPQPLARPLTDVHKHWLNRVSRLNMLFEEARCAESLVGASTWRRLSQALDVADSLHLARSEDRVTFAAMRMTLGGAIELAPRVQEMLAQTRDVGVSLATLRAELSEEDKDLIRTQAQEASNRA